MLFEGVPEDLASLLRTLILWPDLEKKKSYFYVCPNRPQPPTHTPLPERNSWYSLETQSWICYLLNCQHRWMHFVLVNLQHRLYENCLLSEELYNLFSLDIKLPRTKELYINKQDNMLWVQNSTENTQIFLLKSDLLFFYFNTFFFFCTNFLIKLLLFFYPHTIVQNRVNARLCVGAKSRLQFDPEFQGSQGERWEWRDLGWSVLGGSGGWTTLLSSSHRLNIDILEWPLSKEACFTV